LSSIDFEQHIALAARSLPSIRALARPPSAIKWASLASSPALLPHLYITHKSTYGQRYLPSPPAPSPALRARGWMLMLYALKDTPAMVCERSPLAANTTFG